MDKDHAKKHSMDISHVSAVELPLAVKDTARAIAMLGGKERVRRAVNSQYRQSPIQPSSHSVDERNLELRLRNDPFHHPVQASVNRREKILLKVRIPKSSLPGGYHANPGRYSVRELIQRNSELGGAAHTVEPVAIINKNYSFRAIADFQMSTKNNATVQKFNDNILHSTKVEQTRDYYLQELTIKDEYKQPENYENRDHQLIPPPHFSGVRFPFDYKYQKSPYTVALRDENGDVKVVMKSDSKKLFTNTVDYHNGAIPDSPLPEIVTKYNWLRTTDLSQEYADKKLFECIEQLRSLFEVKPIWLRKSLVDVVPDHLKSAVKEALPYVSYCYKNGPWRFCNVRLGANPKDDRQNWMYQSEYFRLSGQQHRAEARRNEPKITPNTIRARQPDSAIKLSESLFFDGTKLPRTVNYQIGDVLDRDIVRLIQETQRRGDGFFFRATVDPQDGWVKKQPMETIRRLIRYKLRQLQKDEVISEEKVAKIIATDYTEKEREQDAEEDVEEEEEEEEDEDVEEPAEAQDPLLEKATEAHVMSQIKSVDDRAAAKLGELVGLIKQDSLR